VVQAGYRIKLLSTNVLEKRFGSVAVGVWKA